MRTRRWIVSVATVLGIAILIAIRFSNGCRTTPLAYSVRTFLDNLQVESPEWRSVALGDIFWVEGMLRPTDGRGTVSLESSNPRSQNAMFCLLPAVEKDSPVQSLMVICVDPGQIDESKPMEGHLKSGVRARQIDIWIDSNDGKLVIALHNVACGEGSFRRVYVTMGIRNRG